MLHVKLVIDLLFRSFFLAKLCKNHYFDNSTSVNLYNKLNTCIPLLRIDLEGLLLGVELPQGNC